MKRNNRLVYFDGIESGSKIRKIEKESRFIKCGEVASELITNMQPRVVLTDILKSRNKLDEDFKHFVVQKDSESSNSGDNLCKINANLEERNNHGDLYHHERINSTVEDNKSNSHVIKEVKSIWKTSNKCQNSTTVDESLKEKRPWIIDEYLKDNGYSDVPVLDVSYTTGAESQESHIDPLPYSSTWKKSSETQSSKAGDESRLSNSAESAGSKSAESNINPRPFSCDACTTHYTCKEKLAEHMLKHTSVVRTERKLSNPDTVYSATHKLCKICRMKFLNTDTLLTHIKQHISYRPYICHLCTYDRRTFIQKTTLDEHLEKTHRICQTESKNNDKNVKLYSLGRTNKQQDQLVCHTCGLTFPTIFYLRRHLSLSNHKPAFPCSVTGCTWTFLSLTDLKRHLYGIHKDEVETESFPCQGCGRVFFFQEDLERHKKSSLTCQKEGKKNHKAVNIYSSDRTNRQQDKPVCRTCGSTFSSAINLIKHLSVSNHKSQFLCSVQGCTSTFLLQSDLKRHLNFVHKGQVKNGLHSCGGCRRFFFLKTELENHEKSCLYKAGQNSYWLLRRQEKRVAPALGPVNKIISYSEEQEQDEKLVSISF